MKRGKARMCVKLFEANVVNCSVVACMYENELKNDSLVYLASPAGL